MTQAEERDHGGGLDAAIARFGGTRTGWLDLSTGINPVPYPVGAFDMDAWTALPDKGAQQALIAAAETARDALAAAKMLRELDLAFTGEVIDVAETYGGSSAKSFDAVAHWADVPFVPMTRADLEEAHRTGCHGAIREHLAARVKATWQLWLASRKDAESLVGATEAWLATSDSQVTL